MGFTEWIMNLDTQFQCAKTRFFVATEEFKNKVEDYTVDDWVTEIECGVLGVKREIELKIYEFGVTSEYLSEELSGKTMVEDNNVKIVYINKLNEEMQKMFNETSNSVAQAKSAFDTSNEKLFVAKQRIYQTTLADFAHTVSNLKKVDFGKFDGNKLIIQDITNQISPVSPCKIQEMEHFDSLNYFIIHSVAGSLGVMISAAWKSIELDEKMVEAEKRHAELKAQCEKAKMDSTKLKGITELCNTSLQAITTLEQLTVQLISETQKIIEACGSNFTTYNNEQKNTVKLMIQFALALHDIIHTDLLTANGTENRKYTEVFNSVQSLIQWET